MNAETREDVPADVQMEGVEIVEELLRQWATSEEADEGDDVAMLSDEASLESLKQLVQDFGPRIEANAWVKGLLQSL